MSYVTSGSNCSVVGYLNGSVLQKKLCGGIARVVHAEIDRGDWYVTVFEIVVERKHA
jgi:hypothetical protein